MVITSLDFQQARIKQVLFKSRLRSVLYGVREADAELFSLQHNPLGQWLQTVVKPHYSGRPEVRELERALQRMLDTGRELADQYRRGQLEEARAGLERIDIHAAQIEELLQRLERNAS
ncbi:hypothetical protein F0P96_17515 [Hymenobacter busanensis]|uniref:Uncharacterized protein n=1 Tax=Hymenobacter busanensis TaxID=2607656 RepID=A0A7L5A533_9BACT|nr:hypothetical protein [Hymenobacter busanensis]KAA9327039.1 hypothetical protein F0P96_17515 [Hymenobacter busanensis]QHJ09490.1 hypothetical protein GUY19_20330 [Hymenobacter busanensis]